ncbi:MAG: hypothetical protein BRC33_02645 [Cyanobacteria bacterium SW_9_44_58]|nr:MAG: hypothetical protein BRC33_02645 [Cyanobacteria bacterium SW_9_44_58]
MTELFEKAIERIKRLEASEQDAIAVKILEELEDEDKWNTAFAQSQDSLAKLAAEAMEEYNAGQTEALDSDKL